MEMDMGIDRLNRWLTLAANIGVLIGLIFLVVEVRHAISLSESQAFRNRGTEIQEAYLALALSVDLAPIMAKTKDEGVSSLNSAEFIRLAAWFNAMLLRMQNQFNDYQLGYLDEASYLLMLRAAAESLPMIQQLDINLRANFDPEFLEAVKSLSAE